MQKEKLHILIDKYLNGTVTPAERREIDNWYQQHNEKDVVWTMEDAAERENIEKEMLSVLQSHVRSEREKTKTITFKTFYRIAAAIAACCLIASYYFYKEQEIPLTKDSPLIVSLPAKINENRFITLPDSSTLVLHPGSSIKYAMVGHERRLVLNGEAYFDIRHRADQPFVVITGAVKTTVLGTAFNIRAYSGEGVIVSVTRGKVSVMNDLTKDLAILLPNQQVTLNADVHTLTPISVKAQQSVQWANADMQIDDMPFAELAAKLSRRYNVDIRFKNPKMEKCLISGRFTGTEKLDEVLDVISRTMGSTYKMENSVVILDGQECVN